MSTKLPMHFILKSAVATGPLSFRHPKNLKAVNDAVTQHCLRYGVKLMMYSNNFNHLHMILKFASRAIYLRFVRTLSARLAMIVTGARKTSSLASVGIKRFWDRRPFTRIIDGYKNLKTAIAYVRLNQLEAEGAIPKRSGRLRDVRALEWQMF